VRSERFVRYTSVESDRASKLCTLAFVLSRNQLSSGMNVERFGDSSVSERKESGMDAWVKGST
jgi:hypothetical protein